MTTATLDPQAALDDEDAAVFRKQIRRLAQDVRTAEGQEGQRKEVWRTMRQARAKADEELAKLVEDDGSGPDADYLARLNKTSRRAEAAKQDEHEAHDRWVLAVTARRRAQDELRVAVRRRFAPAPLFDATANQQVQETHQEVQNLNQEVQEVKPPLAWRDTPVTAMGLPPATVRQLQLWGLQDAGQVADLINDGSHVAGLNTEAHQEIIAAMRMIDRESEPCIQEIVPTPAVAWRDTPIADLALPHSMLAALQHIHLDTAGKIADALADERPIGIGREGRKHLQQVIDDCRGEPAPEPKKRTRKKKETA